MSDTTWYREKNKLEKMKLERLYHIAKYRFDEQHLERIDTCETIQKMMWRNFNEEKDPCKRNQILKDIVSLQSYLSAYYEATKDVMKQSVYMKRYYNPELETDKIVRRHEYNKFKESYKNKEELINQYKMLE